MRFEKPMMRQKSITMHKNSIHFGLGLTLVAWLATTIFERSVYNYIRTQGRIQDFLWGCPKSATDPGICKGGVPNEEFVPL